MANKEHVKLIKAGVKHLSWAELSEANLMEADLSRASLHGADLSGADLTRANLSEANLTTARLRGAKLMMAKLMQARLFCADLSETDLSGAELGQANLMGADLNSANLTGADLSGADLSRADLRRATLVGADLSLANLNGAKLDGANLSEVVLGRSVFADNDLSTVKGLERVRHKAPSTVGIDTLYKSDGKIPELFLRGVGFAEVFILYLRSLTAQPIEFYSCFISYSHANKGFARRLHDTLQSRGIRCWLDEHELLPGDKVYAEVDCAIRLCDKVLLCCSKEALTSWWVDNEVKIAFEKEQHLWKERGKEVLALIPLNLDDYLFSGQWKSGLATEVKARLAANFTGWERDTQKFEEQFERLVRALRTDSGRKGPPPQERL